jgi:hypothetical protein
MTWKQNTWMTCHTQIIFHKRLTKCICCKPATYNLSTHLQSQFLMLTLTCTQMFMWVLKLLLTLPIHAIGSCVCERSFSALRCLKIWCPATMNEERLCELAMLHVHRNDTVVQEKPEAVLKRFDRVAIGNSILHSPTKYCHLRLFT